MSGPEKSPIAHPTSAAVRRQTRIGARIGARVFPAPPGVKPGQFIAGADLTELAALASITPEQAGKALGAGHQIFSGWSNLPFPTVALIDGCRSSALSSAVGFRPMSASRA